MTKRLCSLLLGLLLLPACATPRLLGEVLREPAQTLPPAPAADLDRLVEEGSGTGWFAASLFEAADLPKQAFAALREPRQAEGPWEPWLRTLAAARLAAENPAIAGDPVGKEGGEGPWEDLRLAALAELREVRGLGLAREQGGELRGENPILPRLRVAGPFPLDPLRGLDSRIVAEQSGILEDGFDLNGLSLPTFEVAQLGGAASIPTRGMGLYLVEGWFAVERAGGAVVSVTADEPLRVELQQLEVVRSDRDRSFEGDRSNAWVQLGKGVVRLRVVVAASTGQVRMGLRVTPTAIEGARLASAQGPVGAHRAKVKPRTTTDPVRELREALADALFGGMVPPASPSPLWWFEFARATGDEELQHALAVRSTSADSPLHAWRRATAYHALPWYAESERGHLARSLLEEATEGWSQDTLPEVQLAAALVADGRGRLARERLSALPGLRRSPAALLELGAQLRDEGDADAGLRLLLDALPTVPSPCRLADAVISWRASDGAFGGAAPIPSALRRCEEGRAWRLDHESLAQGRMEDAFDEARALAALRPADLERARRLLLIAGRTDRPNDREETLAHLRRTLPEPAALASMLAAEAKTRDQAEAALRDAAEATPTDLRRELAAYRLGLPSLIPNLDARSERLLREHRTRTAQVASGATYLLDAMDVRVATDGSALTLVHQLIELGSRDSLDELGELNIPGEGELLRARSIKPDGKAFPVADTDGKESLSFANLEVGDIIEIAYLLESRPFAPEVWAPSPRFLFRAPDAHFVESSVTYEFPAAWEKGLIVDARFTAAPVVTRTAGRVKYAFTEHDMTPFESDEPGAPEEEFVPSVAMARNFNMATWLLWRNRWQWFDEVAPRRLLAATIAQLPAGDDEATLRSLFRHVNAAVLPAEDWARPTGFSSLLRLRGDRSAALKLLLSARGFAPDEVAIRSIDADPLPRPVFDHGAWSYRAFHVEVGGDDFWLDPEDDDAVFNLLPRSVQSSTAVNLADPSRSFEVDAAPRASWQNRIRASLALNPDGSVRGELTESVPLSDAAAFRRFVQAVPDEQERRQRSERRLSRTFPAIRLDELSVDGLADLDAPLSVRYRFGSDGFARTEGDTLRFEGSLFARPLAQAFAQSAERSSPLRADAYLDESVHTEMAPPPGLHLTELPRPADINCGGMSYRRSVRVAEGVLIVEHTIVAPYRYVAAADYPAFAACAASIEEAQRFAAAWSR